MGETLVGGYLLERRLAVGGMAEVFLARVSGPEGFEKRVVVKRILDKHLERAEYLTMFLDEARLAARFNHPNLISVYDLSKVDGRYYLAMEYLEGADLATVMVACANQGRFPPPDLVAFIIAEAAAGLHYAHELRDDDGTALNVVHRDISPGNLVATWHGVVKVVDFGIAKHTTKELQTEAGVVKGKLGYMSPEHVAGDQPLDRRTDIFALGSVLYELLTLSRCYRRSTPLETYRAITEGDYVPVSEYRDDVPPGLLRIMARAMNTLPEQRYPTADELCRELRRFMALGTMPGNSDLAAFLHSLLDEKTEVTRRVFVPVGQDDLRIQTEADPRTQESPDPEGEAHTARLPAPGPEAPGAGGSRGQGSWRGLGLGGLVILVVALATVAAVVLLRPSPAEGPPGAARGAEVRAPPDPGPETESESEAEASMAGDAAEEEEGGLRSAGGGRPRARLTVSCEPSCQVGVDGRSLTGSPAVALVPAGTHSVRCLHKRLGLARQLTVRTDGRRPGSAQCVFAKGRVQVWTEPWAEIWHEGKKLDISPAAVELWEGDRVLDLVNPESKLRKRVKVTVEPGRTILLKQHL